jgi:palmitoyl-protein thioesterase
MLHAIIYSLICFFTVIAGGIARSEQLPIVLVNGIMADDKDMKPLEEQIHKALPNAYVKSVHILKGKWTSWKNMYEQGEDLCHDIKADPKLKDGFIFIAHSQGGLLARYYVQQFNNPKCETLITLGSPHQGTFGLPGKIDERLKFLNYFENAARWFLYRSFMQNHVSCAQYYHNTLHVDQYLNRCNFLPYLNNSKPHDLSEHYKANIVALKHFVMVNSTAEAIVEPACSCHFGFYKDSSKEIEENLIETSCYKEDSLGLKTLDDAGKLYLLWCNCAHTDYQEDGDCFKRCILPFLKNEEDSGLKILLDYDEEC